MSIFVTVDLGNGDSGKGSVVDALVRRYKGNLVIRYNGGSQAAHNVVTPDGRHHTFSQFGAGTFNETCKTLLSKHVLVNPLSMQHEESALRIKGIFNGWNRMHVDERALVVLPFHRALNRLRELDRGVNRHGSCGCGIGAAVEASRVLKDQALRVGDLRSTSTTAAKMAIAAIYSITEAGKLKNIDSDDSEVKEILTAFKAEPAPILKRYKEWVSSVAILSALEVSALVEQSENIVFEGAQGVLLDQDYGFPPYNTWSDTTMTNAFDVLLESECRRPITTVGILRTYATRHGPGPFPTEDRVLTKHFTDKYNPANPWQGAMRCGWFDFPALCYALQVNAGVDCVAINHLDVARRMTKFKACYAYDGAHPYPLISGILPDETATLNLMKAKPIIETVADVDIIGQEIFKHHEIPTLIRGYGDSAERKVFVPGVERRLVKVA